MLRVNFYGGPGVGKSTLAARVYAELNRTGAVSTELVREFVKTWAYENKIPDAFDQVFTFANQLWAEHRLAKAGIKVVVTDLPILLQCVYANRLNSFIGMALRDVAFQYENGHTSLNFFVKRRVAYDPSGRFQTPDALAELDESIQAFLDELNIRYLLVVPSDWDTIIATVKEAAYSQLEVHL